MTSYPDPTTIRAALLWGNSSGVSVLESNFFRQALKACDEADVQLNNSPYSKDGRAIMNIQTIAKLQLVEAVLNG